MCVPSMGTIQQRHQVLVYEDDAASLCIVLGTELVYRDLCCRIAFRRQLRPLALRLGDLVLAVCALELAHRLLRARLRSHRETKVLARTTDWGLGDGALRPDEEHMRAISSASSALPSTTGEHHESIFKHRIGDAW